jgi:o-succinylbenzoate---CoA ligase
MEFSRSGLETWAWRKMREAPVWEKQHLLLILHWLAPSSELVVYTSGSTGVPRPVSLPKSWLKSSAALTADFLGLRERAEAWLPLPSAGIGGKMMIIRSLELGWHLQWQEPKAHMSLPDGLHVDITAMTPMQLIGLSDASITRIGNMLIGGAGLTDAHRSKMVHAGCRFIGTYGMTETGSHVAICELNNSKGPEIYTSLPGVTFEVDE